MLYQIFNNKRKIIICQKEHINQTIGKPKKPMVLKRGLLLKPGEISLKEENKKEEKF